MPDVNFDGTSKEDQEVKPELDAKFAELAVAQGLVTSAQVDDAVTAHRTVLDLGLKRSLSEIMVEKGLLTQVQAETVRRTAESDGNVKIVGGFELLNKLGEGGMGVVYKANQLSLDRVVALKILPERLAKDREYVARFVREARVAAKLDHVNVVRALDVGEASGMRYFAMELVDGESLGEILDRDGKMAEDKALSIMIQSARALEHAHHHQLIHRDIKPDNILVTAEGVAKIADLGLARSTDSNSTRMTVTGVAMGTPHYISPEQARGEADIDIRTDIYSLGVTFFHTLSGHPPFQGSTAAVVLTRRLTEDPPWIRDVVPEISEGTALVIKKMMARDRTTRYTNPKDLLHDLELVADGKLPEIARGEAATARPKDPARSTGAVPIVKTGEQAAKKGTSTALLAGIGGVAVVALGIVLALVLGKPSGDGTSGGNDQDATQVFKIMSDVKALEDERKYGEAIAMVQTAESSFQGTAHAQKFATRLSELQRAKERETTAHDHLELIQKLADAGNKAQALEAARKGVGQYDSTSAAEGLAAQLQELEKWASEQDALDRELQTATAVIEGLEKEGAYDSALERARAAYEKMKNAPGAKKLADAIERLEKLQGNATGTVAEAELAAIQELTAKGGLEEALKRATEAATKYASTPSGKTLAETREHLKTLVAKQSVTKRLDSVLKEAATASEQRRFADAIKAYEQALTIDNATTTQKLLLDAKIGLHLAKSEEDEAAGELKSALDQVNLAITLKPTPAARTRRDELKGRIAFEGTLQEARGLEKAGDLKEARAAYTRAMKGATPAQQKRIKEIIDGLAKRALDAQAKAEFDEVKALYAKADFDTALVRASSAAAQFSTSSLMPEFKKLAEDAKRELEKGKEADDTAATISALLAKGDDAATAGRDEEAVKFYERAAAMAAPAGAKELVTEAKYKSSMTRSHIEEKAGKLDEAVARASEAADIKPTPEAAKRLAMLKVQVGLAKKLAAARALEAAGKLDLALAAYRELQSNASSADAKAIEAAIQRLSSAESTEISVKFETSPSGMRLAFIPAGEYLVGDSKGQRDEKPVRRVSLKAYYIGVNEVTNVQYARFNPRYRGSKYSKGATYPAIGMTWSEAVGYCAWLSKQEDATYRLPTEAEWEVAARGTDGRNYPWGDEPVSEGTVHRANWGKGSDPVGGQDGFRYAAPVGSFPRGASPFGCLDMGGNVWEWCMDWYGEDYYAEGVTDNPTGPEKGKEKIVRGGSWYHPASYVRSANRFKLDPRRGQPSVGFRVVREVQAK